MECFKQNPDSQIVWCRYSEVWDSNIWSGRLISCSTNLDLEWTRVCQKDRYLTCIRDIMDEEGIKNITTTTARTSGDAGEGREGSLILNVFQ